MANISRCLSHSISPFPPHERRFNKSPPPNQEQEQEPRNHGPGRRLLRREPGGLPGDPGRPRRRRRHGAAEGAAEEGAGEGGRGGGGGGGKVEATESQTHGTFPLPPSFS